MNIACTGFVSEQAGSVASANALLLRALLDRGHTVTFFSKPSFVDPRPVVGEHVGFHFVPVVNALQDELRQRLANIPCVGFLAQRWDAASYNHQLVKAIRHFNQSRPFDVILWLGDFARGAVPGAPTVSFLQGAPGSDARSILKYGSEIQLLNGVFFAWRLALLARARLSRAGLPPFHHSDGFIVGSPMSESILHDHYGISRDRTCSLPYPIDLELFSRREAAPHSGFRVLWLGRIVPRKRLKLFLDGIRLARQSGLDVRATVVGRSAGLGNYEKMLSAPLSEGWLSAVPTVERHNVPGLMAGHDVLAQPSEEENFGSSVAEAQACGMPVIVGQTNGNSFYLSERDLVLSDGMPDSFSAAICEMVERKASKKMGTPECSRQFAERTFGLDAVTDRLETALRRTINRYGSKPAATASEPPYR